MVKNIDVFTPIVDEPEIMGQIAASNVTSDIFAMNVPDISGMLVFLGINTNTPMEVAEIGGEASGFAHKDSIILKQGVKKGDKLILTKPIGLQGTMAAYRTLKNMPEMLEQYSKSELQKSIDYAIELMITPNQNVVKTIHSYQDFSFVHALTDVTGFGLSGHIKELLQNSTLSAIIETIPSIRFSKELSEELGYAFDDCSCHETAGGMLIAIDPKKVEEFSNTLISNNVENWIVGTIDNIEPGLVRVADNVENVEIVKY